MHNLFNPSHVSVFTITGGFFFSLKFSYCLIKLFSSVLISSSILNHDAKINIIVIIKRIFINCKKEKTIEQ